MTAKAILHPKRQKTPKELYERFKTCMIEYREMRGGDYTSEQYMKMTACAKEQIQNGIDVNDSHSQKTPLVLAAEANHVEIIEMLLQRNATFFPNYTILKLHCFSKSME